MMNKIEVNQIRQWKETGNFFIIVGCEHYRKCKYKSLTHNVNQVNETDYSIIAKHSDIVG